MEFLRCIPLLLILWIVRTDADIQTFYLDTELCNQKINMSSYNNEDLHSFRLKLSEQHYYPHNLDCQLQIQAQRDSENIMFYFKYFDVRPYVLPESYCAYDWLEIHDGNSTDSQYVCGIDMKLCGISPSRTSGVYFTRSNYLTLYFKSDDQEKYTGFEMVITRFRYGQCRSDEYACANGRCIDHSLQCSGYNACGDGSDCTNLHPGYIMTIVAAAIIFILVIVLGIIVCKLRKSKKIDPHDKTPLNPQSTPDCPNHQEILPKYGTMKHQSPKLPSESTDRSDQAPLTSLLDPPCTNVSNLEGTQSQPRSGKSLNPSVDKHFGHRGSPQHGVSISQETDSCHSNVTEYTTNGTKRSNTEPSTFDVIKENTGEHDSNTIPKRICSYGNLGQNTPGLGFQRSRSVLDNHLDSGYNTPRPGQVDSCIETTYRKLLYNDENTEAKRLHGATHRMQGTPVRGEFDSDKISSFQNSINFC